MLIRALALPPCLGDPSIASAASVATLKTAPVLNILDLVVMVEIRTTV
jgi:hypothetical protein